MKDELSSLLRTKTLDLVEPPRHTSLVSCKWILLRKYNANSFIRDYKAHLVTHDFTHKYDEGYHQTFSPLLSMVSFHKLVDLATPYCTVIHQMNVHPTFLHGDLDEVIHMHHPTFVNPQPSYSCVSHEKIIIWPQTTSLYFKSHTFDTQI